MVDLATGAVHDPDPNEGKDAAAVSLGRRGGLKGGKARAVKMSAEHNLLASLFKPKSQLEAR
jgi:hypothetical protein